MYENEYIDLRVYLDLLLRRRRLIVVAALLAALTAFGVSQLLPPTYEATAALSVAPRRSNITLTQDFVLSEEEQELMDVQRQADALTEIAGSLKVADVVAKAHPEFFGEGAAELEEQKRTSSLARAVEVTTKGDLLVITASADDPEKATALANAWLEATTAQINAVYALSPETEQELDLQREAAWEDYQQAQAALEAYLAESPIPNLEQQISALKSQLSDLYGQANQVKQQLTDARALREQISQGETPDAESWGTLVAFVAMQSRIFGGAQMPGLMQLDLGGPTPSLSLNGVDQLIKALESKQAEIEEEIAVLAPPAGSDVSTDASPPTVAALEAQLESARAELTQLHEARNASWTTYTSVLNKLRELRIERSVSASEARTAFEALPPSEPSSPRVLLNTALAGIVGLMLAVGGVFLMAYLFPEEENNGLVADIGVLQWLLADRPGLPLPSDNGDKGRTESPEERERANVSLDVESGGQ